MIEIYGCEVHQLLTYNAISDVSIFVPKLLEILAPNDNYQIQKIDVSSNFQYSLPLISRTVCMNVSHEDISFKTEEQISKFLDGKYLSDFTDCIHKIENRLDEINPFMEKSTYFVTEPKLSHKQNINTFSTTYYMKYSFSFYRPYTYYITPDWPVVSVATNTNNLDQISVK
jgi:hypothetical protein